MSPRPLHRATPRDVRTRTQASSRSSASAEDRGFQPEGPPGDRVEGGPSRQYKGEFLQAVASRKQVEHDAKLLANRIKLLRVRLPCAAGRGRAVQSMA